ncbi:MAG: NUDIX domain-containing protein [Burkholderiales bacterium]|nr:NUDIX domain-containing protein [Burkholderiales bacterium]
MISFPVNSHRFHYRAAAIVRIDNRLLLHRLEGDEFWALPGGRVHAGELATQAIEREFLEELGSAIACERLLCIGENLFEYNGQPHHEIGLYFAANIPTTSGLLDHIPVHIGVEGDRRLEFKWFAMTELPGIDMRPEALKQAIFRDEIPTHFIQRHNAA